MQLNTQHLAGVLEQKRRRLRVLEMNAARKGSDVEPHIVLEVEDLQREIAQIEDTLRGSVPPLLPFLPDCSAQELYIDDLLECCAGDSSKPIILIIHGDEHQAQDMFAVRLAERTLPERLGLDDLSIRLTSYALEWPNMSLPLKTFARQLDAILRTRTLELQRGQNLAHAIASHPGPVFLHTHLLTEGWAKHGLEGLYQFLSYWNAWPPLRTGQQLLIGLFIKYQGRLTTPANRTMLEALRAEFERQEQGFNGRLWNYERLCGAILPQLEGVTRSDAEYWARSSKDLRLFSSGSLNTLQTGIAAIYQDWAKANNIDDSSDEPVRIPMSKLSDRLIDLLVECTSRSHGRGTCQLPPAKAGGLRLNPNAEAADWTP